MQTLYSQVVNLTANYLGPASERFISRQVVIHLKKKPEELTKEDLTKLIDWLKLSIALLTEDEKIVNDFTASLKALTKK